MRLLIDLLLISWFFQAIRMFSEKFARLTLLNPPLWRLWSTSSRGSVSEVWVCLLCGMG